MAYCESNPHCKCICQHIPPAAPTADLFGRTSVDLIPLNPYNSTTNGIVEGKWGRLINITAGGNWNDQQYSPHLGLG